MHKSWRCLFPVAMVGIVALGAFSFVRPPVAAAKPCGAYSFASSMIMGYSSRQGWHQVAQNVTSNPLPWYLATTFL